MSYRESWVSGRGFGLLHGDKATPHRIAQNRINLTNSRIKALLDSPKKYIGERKHFGSISYWAFTQVPAAGAITAIGGIR